MGLTTTCSIREPVVPAGRGIVWHITIIVPAVGGWKREGCMNRDRNLAINLEPANAPNYRRKENRDFFASETQFTIS